MNQLEITSILEAKDNLANCQLLHHYFLSVVPKKDLKLFSQVIAVTELSVRVKINSRNEKSDFKGRQTNIAQRCSLQFA